MCMHSGDVYDEIVDELIQGWGDETDEESLEEVYSLIHTGLENMIEKEEEFFCDIDLPDGFYDRWQEVSRESLGKVFQGLYLLDKIINNEENDDGA